TPARPSSPTRSNPPRRTSPLACLACSRRSPGAGGAPALPTAVHLRGHRLSDPRGTRPKLRLVDAIAPSPAASRGFPTFAFKDTQPGQTPVAMETETARASLGRDVLAVLDGQDDARTIVEAVAVGLGEIVDALACGYLALGEEGLADRLAEFRRAGLCGLQRNRDDTLQDLERIVGMPGELAAAVRAILRFIGGVERKPGLFRERAV